jgi:hypothetical protein
VDTLRAMWMKARHLSMSRYMERMLQTSNRIIITELDFVLSWVKGLWMQRVNGGLIVETPMDQPKVVPC